MATLVLFNYTDVSFRNDECNTPYDFANNGNQRRKVQGKIIEKNNAFNNSVSVRTTNYRRGGVFTKWVREDADFISQTGCLTVSPGDPGLCWVADESASNTDRIEVTIFESDSHVTATDGSVLHNVTDNQVSGNCTTITF